MSIVCFISIASFYVPIKEIRHSIITEEYAIDKNPERNHEFIKKNYLVKIRWREKNYG